MAGRADWVQRERERAWAFGREFRDGLLLEFQQKYGDPVPPAPALIVYELITDFLGFELAFDPLDLDRYAETSLVNGKVRITVSTRIAEVPGVKDADGIAKVATWHEAAHGVRDVDALQAGPQGSFPGWNVQRKIVCYRSPSRLDSAVERNREFWAEEAGRAAAVSLAALKRTDPFQRLITWRASEIPRSDAWALLYKAAEEIGVNISALVKQLSLESLIVVDRQGGRQTVRVRPALLERIEAV